MDPKEDLSVAKTEAEGYWEFLPLDLSGHQASEVELKTSSDKKWEYLEWDLVDKAKSPCLFFWDLVALANIAVALGLLFLACCLRVAFGMTYDRPLCVGFLSRGSNGD